MFFVPLRALRKKEGNEINNEKNKDSCMWYCFWTVLY